MVKRRYKGSWKMRLMKAFKAWAVAEKRASENPDHDWVSDNLMDCG